IENLGDVVRMDSLDVEADDPRSTLSRRAIEHDSRPVAEPLQRVRGKVVFGALDRLETGRGDVVDRGAESHRLGDGRRAGLELVREIAPSRLLELNLPDQVAAEGERLHLLEQL